MSKSYPYVLFEAVDPKVTRGHPQKKFRVVMIDAEGRYIVEESTWSDALGNRRWSGIAGNFPNFLLMAAYQAGHFNREATDDTSD